MQQDLPKKWRPVHTISMFTAPGSYMALNFLNDKELLPWLKPEMVPYFGFPLLFILCASCLFGAKGVIELIGQLFNKFKILNELEKRYNEEQKKQNGKNI